VGLLCVQGGGAGCGVFVGLLLLVGTLVSCTVSLVLAVTDVIQLTQLVLSLAAAVTSLVTCCVHVRAQGRADRQAGCVLMDTLLVVSVAGVMALGSVDALASAGHWLAAGVSVAVVGQSALQTGVLAAALHRGTRTTRSVSTSPAALRLVANYSFASVIRTRQCLKSKS